VVVQNPVNLGSFEAVRWPVGANGRMACVARLDVSAKGQDVLFEALAGPAWAGRDWRLSVVGGGPDRDYLEALARFYGIAERVDFAGHVGDVRRVWERHELLVLPSRSEGTPLALVEALVAGRPAVVTDVGGSAAWVADGETGFVAPAATPTAVSAALERAWDRRADWERMGAAAHAAAVGRVDRDPGATLLEAILRCR
jgi:glycosyltransferase involved in cell wall biosynthesis